MNGSTLATLSQGAEDRALRLELSILGYSPGPAIHRLHDLEKVMFPLWPSLPHLYTLRAELSDC